MTKFYGVVAQLLQKRDSFMIRLNALLAKLEFVEQALQKEQLKVADAKKTIGEIRLSIAKNNKELVEVRRLKVLTVQMMDSYAILTRLAVGSEKGVQNKDIGVFLRNVKNFFAKLKKSPIKTRIAPEIRGFSGISIRLKGTKPIKMA